MLGGSFFSPSRSTDDMAQAMLTDSFCRSGKRVFGLQRSACQQFSPENRPRRRAAELTQGHKGEGTRSEALYEGGAARLRRQRIRLIELARPDDGRPASARKGFLCARRNEHKRMRHRQSALAIDGTSNYPDATFTLLLSYGTVRGTKRMESRTPAFTDFAGVCIGRSAEHDNKRHFFVCRIVVDKKSASIFQPKFNFVSDADIIGGKQWAVRS